MRFDPDNKGIEVSVARVWKRPDGIIHAVFHDGAIVREEDALEAREAIRRVADEDESIVSLTDISGIRGSDAGARRISPDARTTRLALVVGSPVGRMIGNAWLALTRPPHLVRLFTDEDSAIRWLLGSIER